MLNWLQIHRKNLRLIALSLTALVILSAVLWGFQLNLEIRESLKTKKFLPPTQYFSGSRLFEKDMLISARDFEQLLADRQYRERPASEKLRAGEYSRLPSEECAKQAGSACFVFQVHENGDPWLREISKQYIFFSSDEKVSGTFVGEELQPKPVFLEPQLFAQYLGEEPIQQNYTPLGEIPVSCLNAVLAIEDHKYLEHSGISVLGILRAAVANLLSTRVAQGGSTITQQMVKNYFLTPERTLKRKVTEFIMSLILETHSSKDEIFETYLNIIYLGQNGPFQIRGFPAAAQYYFNKPIQSLELADCALLAAVLNSPGLYDPFRRPENSWRRRNLVLEKMAEYGFVRSSEAESAKNIPLPKKTSMNLSETAPYYIDAVQKELRSLSIPSEGRRIYTGLDIEAQAAAQAAIRNNLSRLENENPIIQKIHESGKNLEAVLISANNKTGLIESIVGGRSYKLTQFNRAIDGHRQVGSIMKPFVFLSALEVALEKKKDYTPLTLLHDDRFTYEYQNQKWSPENYGKKYFGDVPMYFALKNSLNCATAHLGLDVGVGKIIEVARATGIESKLENVPSLTLGAFELFPREILQAYSTLANLGVHRDLRMVRAVTNEYDGIVYQSENVETEVIDKIATAQLVGMMKQVLISGTAKSIRLNGFRHPAAGKTGTTSDYKDSWFAGFTPSISTVVWVGYDDNTQNGLTGSSGAVPIWTEYMKAHAAQFPAHDFDWPAALVSHTYKNAGDDPPEVELLFLPGTEPKN
jgi:penicillin-binding protein 1B